MLATRPHLVFVAVEESALWPCMYKGVLNPDELSKTYCTCLSHFRWQIAPSGALNRRPQNATGC
jgi:hypothetical protein